MTNDDILRDAYGMPRLPTPSDYGAVGDGIHDDTAAIQASIHGLANDTTGHEPLSDARLEIVERVVEAGRSNDDDSDSSQWSTLP